MTDATIGDLGERGRRAAAGDEERAYYALNRKVYPVLSRFYDLVTIPFGGLRIQVARIAGAGAGVRALDVATGTGAQARAFAATGATVLGADLSPAMLRMARRKKRLSNLALLEADATRLPLESGQFDLCSISFALHEMPPAVRAAVLAEMARVTKPGGTVVVVDYALPRNLAAAAAVFQAVKLYERDPYAEFIRSSLEALLEGAGIRVERDVRKLFGIVRIVVGRRATA